jgi:hypothetical protein
LPKKYGCGRTKTMAIIHELARNDDENMTALLKQSPYSVGEISHKKMGLCSLHSRCLERPRMQDFAPFYPELLRAQTPGRIDGSRFETFTPIFCNLRLASLVTNFKILVNFCE